MKGQRIAGPIAQAPACCWAADRHRSGQLESRGADGGAVMENNLRGDRPLTRRHVLQVGGLGLLGITLPRLLESQAQCEAGGIRPKADACVILFLNGGPSHLDMWDLKPNAPEGIRGEFRPIATSLAGYQMSEHLPRLARHAHCATIVRSMHHSVNNAHAAAVYTSLTGHDRGDATVAIGAGPMDYPSPGSLLSFLRPPSRPDPPARRIAIYDEGGGRRARPNPDFSADFWDMRATRSLSCGIPMPRTSAFPS